MGNIGDVLRALITLMVISRIIVGPEAAERIAAITRRLNMDSDWEFYASRYSD